jgi:hypothetical protein
MSGPQLDVRTELEAKTNSLNSLPRIGGTLAAAFAREGEPERLDCYRRDSIIRAVCAERKLSAASSQL